MITTNPIKIKKFYKIDSVPTAAEGGGEGEGDESLAIPEVGSINAEVQKNLDAARRDALKASLISAGRHNMKDLTNLQHRAYQEKYELGDQTDFEDYGLIIDDLAALEHQKRNPPTTYYGLPVKENDTSETSISPYSMRAVEKANSVELENRKNGTSV